VRKLNFGCGGNRLEGWENFDLDVPIERPLPFPDGCASFILAEHVVEHVTPQQAWLFMEECKRVLCLGGAVRICVPDIARLTRLMTDEYREAVRTGGHGDNPIKAAIFSHGHQGAWTQELLISFMAGVGLSACAKNYGQSNHIELHGVDGHGKVVGQSIAELETSVVEGTKC